MERKKLIPIILSCCLLVCAILIYINDNKKIDTYKKLIISFNNKDYTYENLYIEEKIVFDNHEYRIISVNGTELALNTEENIFIDKKEAHEVIIKINEKIDVCYADKTCATFNLK